METIIRKYLLYKSGLGFYCINHVQGCLHGFECSILTKGKLPVELADRKRFPADNLHGISLISLNEEFRKRWEPGSALYSERISALKSLLDSGCQTLVHIEPYPTPNIVEQDLEDILKAVDFVDHIYFSGWNYNAQVKQFPHYKEFYIDQADLVRRFGMEHNIQCDLGA